MRQFKIYLQRPFNTIAMQWIVLLYLYDPSKHEAFTQCYFNVGHRLRRWIDIEKTLGECPVFAGIWRPTHPILVQCWASVAAHSSFFNTGPSSTTLAQRYSNTSPARHTSTPASTATAGRLTNVASMLIQRVWRWLNNNPTFCIGGLHTLWHSTVTIAMRVTTTFKVVSRGTYSLIAVSRNATTQITR